MGLDVRLYKCPDRKRALKMEEAYEASLDKIYEDWNKLTSTDAATVEEEAKFNQRRKEAHEKYEIDGYHHKSVETICKDSKTQPDHLFKIGYMRSSYNTGGINRVADVFDLPDLFEIFEVTDEGYYQVHDWDKIYTNVKDAIEKWQAHVDGPYGKYDVLNFRPWVGSEGGVGSEHEALERFNKEFLSKKEKIEKDEWYKNGWMSSQGNFYPKPLKVVALIAAKWDPLKPTWYYNMPSTYLIHELEDNTSMQWYVTALQIVQEMIEWILEQPNPEHFYMGWSG